MNDTLPKGPSGALRHTIRFARDPYGLFRDAKKKYGDPFTIPTLFGPWFVTGRPEGIETILAADPMSFGPSAAVPVEWFLGPGSIGLISGARHLRERKLIMPAFHGDRMRKHGATIQQNALRRIGELRVGARFTVVPFARELSRENVVRILFGVQDRARASQFDEAIRELIAGVTPSVAFFPLLRRDLFGLTPWRKVNHWLTTFNTLTRDEIRTRRASGEHGDDVLSALLQARDEEGNGMSDSDVRDQLITFLAAGQEASSQGLAWVMYWILREPSVYQRLMDELRPLGAMPDPAALARLPFLGAVLDEAMRIHPIGPSIERRLLKPVEILGHRLAAGTTAVASISLAHANPAVFPEPERFRPERFLERRFSPSEYLPFGGGARRCAGAAYATYEIKVTVGSLLAAHRFELASDRPVRPVRYTVTVGPEGGVKLIHRGLL